MSELRISVEGQHAVAKELYQALATVVREMNASKEV